MAKGSRGGKTAPKKLAVKERRAKAYRLRIDGSMTYPQIAKALGISVGMAHKDVMTGLRATEQELAESGAEMRRIEAEALRGKLRRLMFLRDKLAADVDAGAVKAIGEDRKLVDTELRVRAAYGKLYGLDQPTRVELSVPVDLQTQIDQTLAEIQAGTGDPDALLDLVAKLKAKL